MTFKVLLPNAIPLDPVGPEGATYVSYDVEAPLPTEHLDAAGFVAWGNTPGQLEEAASRLRNLRWVQTLAAGPDSVLDAGFGPEVTITSGRSLHDAPVAEHTLSLVLAAARQLHTAVRAQIGHRWASELGGVQPLNGDGQFRSLRDAQVLVWGFGSIANTLAPLLTALGAHVRGVARTAGNRNGYDVITPDALPRSLPETDVLIMILPSSPHTDQTLSAELIARLPQHAWIVNVGRGNTINEAALISALEERRIAGAALDVFSAEPLSESSDLWDLPNVILTPHAAGGRPLGAGEFISSQVSAILDDTEMRNVVIRT